MNEIKRPTAGAIEAALSAYRPIVDDESLEFGEDTRTFMNLVFQNDRLRMEMIGIAAAIGAPEGQDPSDWQALAKSGHLNAELMRNIYLLCDMFFWVGWHARGAMEAQDDLQKTME
jgi:hypothetical protein